MFYFVRTNLSAVLLQSNYLWYHDETRNHKIDSINMCGTVRQQQHVANLGGIKQN